MKITITIVLIYLVSLSSFSQPTIEWQKSLGGSNIDSAGSVQQTSDGGYIVGGASDSNDGDVTGNQGELDYWVVKLDQLGVIEWQKSLGGSENDYAYSIQQTFDGGYILAGTSRSTDGDVSNNYGFRDCWVVRLSSTGTIEWEKNYGGSGFDGAESIQQTSDGGYILVGNSNSIDGDVTGNHGGPDAWVVKLSSVGGIEWQRSLGGSDFDSSMSIQQTGDGGYIVAAHSFSNDGDVTGNHGGLDFWIVKLTASGIIDWQKSLGGSESDWAKSIQQTIDGGYIVAGHSNSIDGDVTGNHGEVDFWVVKLTASGIIEWQKSLGGSEFDSAWSVQQTVDGGYIAAGVVLSNDGDVTGFHGVTDCWVVKLSATGELEWQKTLGGSYNDYAYSIQEILEDKYVVAGFSQSIDGDVTGNHGEADFWVVKLSSVLDVDENQLNQSVILTPNPNSGRFSLDFSEEFEVNSINVIDTLGKIVYSETNIPSGTFEIDQNLTSGVYFVNVVSSSSETTLKMIVE